MTFSFFSATYGIPVFFTFSSILQRPNIFLERMDEEQDGAVLKNGSSVKDLKDGSSVTGLTDGSSVTVLTDGASVTGLTDGASVTCLNNGASESGIKDGASEKNIETFKIVEQNEG